MKKILTFLFVFSMSILLAIALGLSIFFIVLDNVTSPSKEIRYEQLEK